MKTRPKYDLKVKKVKIKAGQSSRKGTDTGVKMKTEHFQFSAFSEESVRTQNWEGGHCCDKQVKEDNTALKIGQDGIAKHCYKGKLKELIVRP